MSVCCCPPLPRKADALGERIDQHGAAGEFGHRSLNGVDLAVGPATANILMMDRLSSAWTRPNSTFQRPNETVIICKINQIIARRQKIDR